MPRVMIKGGVWRNTEDEILKAAVIKYRNTQWSRIASLLHKKSAKQCKARWFERLEPSIKKTEWSGVEDETLLHLAKLMPCQWHTTGPIIGRTAAQCLKRYEYLLDKAQHVEAADDPQNLRLGEIDLPPETKPARPDPKDMDGDELEMLSEARARLANTQGKKGKRKARKKQLEEARRLTALLKQRELRVGGIDVDVKRGRSKSKHRKLDYNEEIPFEKRPALGFHDASSSSSAMTRYDKMDPDFQRLRQQRLMLNGELTDGKEEREQRKDIEKMKERKVNATPLTMMSDSVKPQRKRGKLVVPEPQISDVEFEQLVKLGRATREAKEAANESGSKASKTLLSDCSLTNSFSFLRALRTLRTPAPVTNLPEAQNIAPTPFTPPGGIQADNATPKVGWPTSVRNKLSITQDNPETPSELATVTTLKEQFERLPTPKNDYEMFVSSDSNDSSLGGPTSTSRLEVKEGLDQRADAEKKRKGMEEFTELCKAVQRDLPRPTGMDQYGYQLSDLQTAEEMIQREMLFMLHRDALLVPPENRIATGPVGIGMGMDSFVRNQELQLQGVKGNSYDEEFTQDEMDQTRELLLDEMRTVKKRMCHDHISLPVDTQVWEKRLAQVLFLPGQKRFTQGSSATKKDLVKSMGKTLELNRNYMAKEVKHAGKLEKKLEILTGGYQRRGEALIKHFQEISDQIEKSLMEKATFQFLREVEEVAVSRRLEVLREDVVRQEDRALKLQRRLSELQIELTLADVRSD